MTMKLHAICDNPDTLTGMALAGVESQVAHSPDELLPILENIGTDIGVVIITSGLAAKNADALEKYRKKNRMPLIAIVPDPVPIPRAI